MAINLVKGQKIDLTKNNSSLTSLLVGLGWDPVKKSKGLLGMFSSAPDVDVDASVFMLRNDKLVDKKDLIFFGNLQSRCGGVRHTGDNLTGDGDGDDEQIIVELSRIPQDVNKLVFVTNIYDCVKRRQHFGMIENAFIRVADNKTGVNIARYNLSDDYNGCTGLIVAEVYRHSGEWKFAAIGQGTNDTGLGDMMRKYI